MNNILDINDSYYHSLETLTLLNKYQRFMDNIKTVADMGCSIGLDSAWWAKLTKEDGSPRNIKVNAIDNNINSNVIAKHPNINYLKEDFTATSLSSNSQDFVWAHDSLQYSLSPIFTLLHWWEIMRVDAMLLVTVPYNFTVRNNKGRLNVDFRYQYNSYFNWSMGSLIMSLVATGFDCKFGHFKIDKENGWIQAAVYKLPDRPNSHLNWYEMCDLDLLPISIKNSIMKDGSFNETDIVCEWIDRSQYMLSI